VQIGTGHWDRGIREAGPADTGKVVHPDRQPVPDAQVVRNGLERLTFPLLGPLPVADMQHRHIVAFGGHCGRDGAVHSPAGKDNGQCAVRHVSA
jgi:hypothetical protein